MKRKFDTTEDRRLTSNLEAYAHALINLQNKDLDGTMEQLEICRRIGLFYNNTMLYNVYQGQGPATGAVGQKPGQSRGSDDLDKDAKGRQKRGSKQPLSTKATVKECLAAGDRTGAARHLRELWSATPTLATQGFVLQTLDRLEVEFPFLARRRLLRLAQLHGRTIAAPLRRVEARLLGLDLLIEVGPFDTIHQELRDPSGRLQAFRPDVRPGFVPAVGAGGRSGGQPPASSEAIATSPFWSRIRMGPFGPTVLCAPVWRTRTGG